LTNPDTARESGSKAGQEGSPTRRFDFSTKQGAAQLPIVGVSLMLAMKIVAAILTGSVAIRADAIHSLLDLVSAIIGYVSIKVAGRPPDEGHRYGHTKAEDLAGIIIGALILVVGGTIVYEGIMRLITPAPVSMIPVGIGVTVAALIINIGISWWVIRIARKTDSVALLAEGKHLYADIMSSVAVLLGLIVLQFTNLFWLDSAIAIVIGIYIMYESREPLTLALNNIMDKRLPNEEEDAIRGLLQEYQGRVVGLKNLRTRKSGSSRFVEMDVVMPRHVSVSEAHRVCHQFAHQLTRQMDEVTVNTHILPCNSETTAHKEESDCTSCFVECSYRIRKKRPV
jgi:cation diffusion facilitator family transporter